MGIVAPESKKKVVRVDPDQKSAQFVEMVDNTKPGEIVASDNKGVAPQSQEAFVAEELINACKMAHRSPWSVAVACARFRDVVQDGYQAAALGHLKNAGIREYTAANITQLADAGAYVVGRNLADEANFDKLPSWTAVRPLQKLATLNADLKAPVQDQIDALHARVFAHEDGLTVQKITAQVSDILTQANAFDGKLATPVRPKPVLGLEKLEKLVKPYGVKVRLAKALTQEDLLALGERGQTYVVMGK